MPIVKAGFVQLCFNRNLEMSNCLVIFLARLRLKHFTLMRNSGGQPVYKAFSGNCPGSSPGALEKGRNGKKGPSLSGGAGEKARFRDGASNRLAGKLAEIREKVKRRQKSGEFLGVPRFKRKQSLPLPWK